MDHRLLSVNNNIPPLFDAENDRFFVDSVSTDIKLGTLQPGDTVSYVYQLTAQGTTHGGEQGYVAFLGDPFGSDVISDNLVLSTTSVSVPEPATWILSVTGLVCIVVALGCRRGASTDGTTSCKPGTGRARSSTGGAPMQAQTIRSSVII